MSAILTADMEGFSTWMQRDEQAVIELLVNTYYQYAQEMVGRFRGVLFQKEGDAVWCEFSNAESALRAGLWLLGKFRIYNQGRSHLDEVKLRVGIAWGGREQAVLEKAKLLESSATPDAVHFSNATWERLEQRRGRPTGRLEEASFELATDGSADDRWMLIYQTAHLKVSQLRDWARDVFTALITDQHSYELLLAGRLACLEGTGTLPTLSRERPFLQSFFFRDTSLEQAARTAVFRSREVAVKEPLIAGTVESPCPVENTDTAAPVFESAPDSPYKFLASYRAADAVIFFGRDAELERLQERVERTSLLILYGKSGVGKTSLLRAGLQALGKGGGVSFVMVPVQSNPVNSLKRELSRRFSFEEATCEELWSRAVAGENPVVLILDQFEQIFVRCDEQERRELIGLVRDLTALSGKNGRIVVSLREDFLADLFSLEAVCPGLTRNRLRLGSLDREAAYECIVEPARLFGVEVEEELALQLLDSFSQDGVHPAELQIVLDRLYRTRTLQDRITLLSFEELGGVGPILAAYLDDALTALPVPEQERARSVLKKLVNERGLRTIVPHAELEAQPGIGSQVMNSILRTLVDTRLVRVVSLGEELCYELAHETLVDRVLQWETPLEVARRHAELTLRQEYRNYRRVGGVLPRDRLRLLSQPGLELPLGGEERKMLVRASVLHGIDPEQWMPTAETQQLCAGLLLDMLSDQALDSDVRRSLILILAGMPLKEQALSQLLDCASQVINPTVLSQLKGVSEDVERGLQKAFEERYFGEAVMCVVPEGTCWVGSTSEGKAARKAATRIDLHSRIESEREREEIELAAFRIDRQAVTNAEYAEFRPGHKHFFPQAEADFPAVNVSYDEAVEYAAWLGKRLPTEEEWEKAARGSDGRNFPWGDEFRGELVNSGESERRAPLPVFELQAGASPYGCLQMSGNVWEWTSTPWEPDSPLMAKKGGCALNFSPLMHACARYEDPPEMRLRWAGFRLVADPR